MNNFNTTSTQPLFNNDTRFSTKQNETAFKRGKSLEKKKKFNLKIEVPTQSICSQSKKEIGGSPYSLHVSQEKLSLSPFLFYKEKKETFCKIGSTEDSRVFDLMKTVNQETTENEEEKFVKEFQKVPVSNQRTFISTILKSYKLYADQKKLAVIFNQLKQIFPNLSDYLEFTDSGRVFKPKGIQVLVSYLKATGEMDHNFSCFVCGDCESFQEELYKLAKVASVGERYGFIVRCQSRSSKIPTAHVTAIYLQKTDTQDGWKVLHLDAAGHETSTLPILCLPKVLNSFRLYQGGEKRQTNSISCAVFALYDLAQLSKRSQFFEQLDQEIEKNPSQLKSSTVILTSDYLPIELLKLTQNASRLKFYFLNNKFSQSNITEEIKQLTKYISISHKDLSEINDFPRLLHLKYERHLVDTLVQQAEGESSIIYG